jgi:hypothetical protein
MHDFINELLFEDAIERTGVASSTTGQSRRALCKGRDTAPMGSRSLIKTNTGTPIALNSSSEIASLLTAGPCRGLSTGAAVCS